jgi:hypothetical protein
MSQSQSIGKIFKLGLTKNADWGPESDEVSSCQENLITSVGKLTKFS